MADYDLITIGGGLGGAALAKSMAQHGARVLVIEREQKFKDRVRGEGMTSWGVAEAQALGIFDLLDSGCGHTVPLWENYIGPMQVGRRDVRETTPQGTPTLCFYHPAMQEAVLAAAEQAGAEVRRGPKVTGVGPGAPASVRVESEGGASEEISARLVVAADGRGSTARKWAGFSEQHDPGRLRISGLLFDGCSAPDDTVRLTNDFATSSESILFPQGGSRARVYVVHTADDSRRYNGEKDVPRFIEACIATGMPSEYFAGAEAAGPLATFDGTEGWVDEPYSNGVALVGDAAAWTDPSWGQGLSLTARDARVLRDNLIANDDWDAAGRAYATEHDRYFETVRTVENWLTTFFFEKGQAGDERRARAFPLIAQDPTRMPDLPISGPDIAVDESTRRRFFAEEEVPA